MRQIKTLCGIAALVVTSAFANAQCKDGVCRIPEPNLPGEYQHSSFLPSTSFGDYQVPSQPSVCANGNCLLNACPACDCNGVNCNCGPNCPPHLDNHNRMPSGHVTRRLLTPAQRILPATYEAGRLQAPRPVANHYQAANFTPTIEWTTSFQQGVEESRRTGRPMLVKVTAEWCGYCHKMKRDTYSDYGTIRNINAGFVAIELDADQNRQLVQQLGVRTLPAVVFITPNQKIVERIEGYKTVRQLNVSLLRHTQKAELQTDIKVATR